MSYLTRRADRGDVPRLAKLLADYVQETYHGAWGGTPQQLAQHVAGKDIRIIVAETADREVIAFVAWVAAYDLHWCMKGGDVVDLFVCPAHRSRGVAVLLLAEMAREVQQQGGTFIKGGAVETPVIRRLYQRVAMCLPGGECYVSGRAFRRLAELAGKRLREVVRKLPEPAWNSEP